MPCELNRRSKLNAILAASNPYKGKKEDVETPMQRKLRHLEKIDCMRRLSRFACTKNW